MDRREFISKIVSASAALSLLAGRDTKAANDSAGPFEMLVIGDSMIWGQGLAESDKFYSLTRDWIETELIGRPVRLTVKAHSGSTLKLDPKERIAFEKARRTGDEEFHPEVNVSFPTIDRQLEAAVNDYRDPAAVSLILLSGGIPDVGVAKILDPFESDSRLRESIDLYCRRHMTDLLSAATAKFPNALIGVVGYYPIITRHTPMKVIVNDVMELYETPGWAKPLINNPVKRNFWRLWKGKMVKRSRIWSEHSTAAFEQAVKAANENAGSQRAIFIPSPIRETEAYGSKASLLFRVARGGKAADAKGDVRLSECTPALKRLKEETKLKYKPRFCELASIGHPNPEGSAAIAESVKRTIEPFLRDRLAKR